MSNATHSLRLAIYDALEASSHLTVPELTQLVDSGAPVLQAQLRAVLRAEPEVFWPEEERWDLAIFHRFAEQPQLFHGRKGQTFDQERFLKTVLAEAMRLKGEPIDLVTLAEKYLLKVRKSLGEVTRHDFPADRQGILERLTDFASRSWDFHLLRQNGDAYLWIAAEWPERAEIAPSIYFLPGDFLDRAFDFLDKRRRHEPTRLLTILQETLGIDANHTDFSAAFAQANSALTADSESFVQVREQTWMLAHYLPTAIEEIPARIAIPRWRNPQEEKLVDSLYEQWPVAALEEAQEFVGEEDPVAPDDGFDESYLSEVRFILPFRWRQAGVLKVNARERRLFPDRPARVHLQFHDQYGQTFPVWLNNDTGYLYGLQDWYAAYLVPAGGVFYLQRSPGSKYDFKVRIQEGQAHTFDGKHFFCEVDPDTYIEEDRLRDLEALRAKVEAAQATVKDVVCDVFESSGSETELHYKQVWAQVHVVRPTTRRTVASILSAFPCFYQVEPGSGHWRYAPGLRSALPKPYQAKRPSKAVQKPQTAVEPVLRPARYWLVPVHATNWDNLARRAEASADVFLVPWRGRSRVVRGDRLAFLDGKNEVLLAAAEALREPVQNDATGQREVAVRPLLPAFAPVPYVDLAGSLSVPKPEADSLPVEITPEDMDALLKGLRPLMAPKPTEPSIDELLKQALPSSKPSLVSDEESTSLADFVLRFGRDYDPKQPYERSAFAFPVKAARSGTIYNAHSYHTKVPPEGIVPYLEHYTKSGDLVLDPFAGSGMTGVACLLTGRNALLSDLSPAAVHIARNYCTPIELTALLKEYERIKIAMSEEIDRLFGTTCDSCGGSATIQYTLWSDVFECGNCAKDIILWDVAVDFAAGQFAERFLCPSCGSEWRKADLNWRCSTPVLVNYECHQCKNRRGSHAVTSAEFESLQQVASAPIQYWFPSIELDTTSEMYIRGALHLRGLRSTNDFFTKRNLRALSRLWHEIQATASPVLRDRLAFVFTAILLPHATIMTRAIFKGSSSLVLTSHQSGILYIPSISVEKNVLEVYARKFRDIYKASEEIAKLTSSKAVAFVSSATDLHRVPSDVADYVFTDPPFGSNIFYADLNFLWEAWLGQFTVDSQEAVINRSKKNGKTLEDYTRLMTESFAEMYRVLKPGRWASVVFHNSDDRVWQAIQQAAETAGFDLVNAMVFDKEQRSFKGIRGEKGLEKVTNFDIVLNLHKRAEVQWVAVPGDQTRIEQVVVAAVEAHLRAGPAPDYRTGQYLHSQAIRALLNEKISVELTWPQLDRLLEQHFRHINCHWYLPKEAVAPSGYGFLVRSDTAAVAWLEHILAASPQTESDLIPQWQIATLGAGSRIKSTLEQLLNDHFWQDETTGLWCVPTIVQREILKRRRARPQQLGLGLEETTSGPQIALGLE